MSGCNCMTLMCKHFCERMLAHASEPASMESEASDVTKVPHLGLCKGCFDSGPESRCSCSSQALCLIAVHLWHAVRLEAGAQGLTRSFDLSGRLKAPRRQLHPRPQWQADLPAAMEPTCSCPAAGRGGRAAGVWRPCAGGQAGSQAGVQRKLHPRLLRVRPNVCSCQPCRV